MISKTEYVQSTKVLCSTSGLLPTFHPMVFVDTASEKESMNIINVAHNVIRVFFIVMISVTKSRLEDYNFFIVQLYIHSVQQTYYQCHC